MKNHTAVIIDHYLQQVEAGIEPDIAEERTHHWMLRFREEMKREDYLIAYELVSRIAKA